jgi:hypothetical protein
MAFRKRGFRAIVLGLLVATGLALTPAAFARSHVSFGVSVPGVAIGYGPGYYGYYAPAYGPAYYDPYYYDSYYYSPRYYGPSVVYYDSYGHRHYRHHRDRYEHRYYH